MTIVNGILLFFQRFIYGIQSIWDFLSTEQTLSIFGQEVFKFTPLVVLSTGLVATIIVVFAWHLIRG